MSNPITAADKKAIRNALQIAFPGWKGSITADKRQDMEGCYRILGRVSQWWTQAQWWTFHQLVAEIPVRITGLQAALEYADKVGRGLVQLGIEPRD